jgi:hypothetical protein
MKKILQTLRRYFRPVPNYANPALALHILNVLETEQVIDQSTLIRHDVELFAAVLYALETYSEPAQ